MISPILVGLSCRRVSNSVGPGRGLESEIWERITCLACKYLKKCDGGRIYLLASCSNDAGLLAMNRSLK